STRRSADYCSTGACPPWGRSSSSAGARASRSCRKLSLLGSRASSASRHQARSPSPPRHASGSYCAASLAPRASTCTPVPSLSFPRAHDTRRNREEASMAIKQLNPYLNFDGTAAKAIALYEKALGAKVDRVQKFGDMPGNTPPETKDRVMHASLRIGP